MSVCLIGKVNRLNKHTQMYFPKLPTADYHSTPTKCGLLLLVILKKKTKTFLKVFFIVYMQRYCYSLISRKGLATLINVCPRGDFYGLQWKLLLHAFKKKSLFPSPNKTQTITLNCHFWRYLAFDPSLSLWKKQLHCTGHALQSRGRKTRAKQKAAEKCRLIFFFLLNAMQLNYSKRRIGATARCDGASDASCRLTAP